MGSPLGPILIFWAKNVVWVYGMENIVGEAYNGGSAVEVRIGIALGIWNLAWDGNILGLILWISEFFGEIGN